MAAEGDDVASAASSAGAGLLLVGLPADAAFAWAFPVASPACAFSLPLPLALPFSGARAFPLVSAVAAGAVALSALGPARSPAGTPLGLA